MRNTAIDPDVEEVLRQGSRPNGADRHTAQREIPKPAPLDKAAFYGVAGEFVRIVEPHTESDPAALLSQFLAAAGCYLGHGSYYLVGADRHYTNLYIVEVGKTSKGRKGTSFGHVRQVFERIDPAFLHTCLTTGLSTGEGLIHHVRDARTEVKAVKENGKIRHEETVVDTGVTDKRLLVVEPEFSRALKAGEREGNTLTATMRQGWDTGDLATMTKNTAERARGAHISIVGHITKDEINQLLLAVGPANGYGNRFLWFWVERSKLLPFGGDLNPEELDDIGRKLKMARDTTQWSLRVQFDDDAKASWNNLYASLSIERLGLLGAILDRAEAQVVRLATLYALLDRVTQIGLRHLNAALAVWKYCEASVRFIFGNKLGDPTADTILDCLKTVGQAGATRTQINRLFGSHKDSAEIERALGVLLREDLVRSERESTAGAPSERWFFKGA